MKARSGRLGIAAAICIPAIVLAGYSSVSASATTTSRSTLTIANFDPFSGPNAGEGFSAEAGCVPAVKVVNEAGGVLGHELTCKVVDNRGDPADAVPAAQQMLATTSNLVGIVDEDSGLLSTTVPLFNQAHIPDMSLGGDVSFDHSTYKYFWRNMPGDDVAGDVLAAYAKFETPYRRVDAVFVNDVSAQGNVPGLENGAKNLGLKLVHNYVLALDQTSYETEIARIKADHPDALIMETDPQTGAVLLSQMKQAGFLPPIICTGVCVSPDWVKSATAALGSAQLQKEVVSIQQWAPSSGAAYMQYKKAILASASQIRNVNSYVNDIYPEDNYDQVIMMALAMTAAHSTDPTKWNADLGRLTTGSTVVHTYSQGKAALARGKSIDYVGVEGQIHFDKYHNAAGIWAGFNPVSFKTVKVMPAIDVTKAVGHA